MYSLATSQASIKLIVDRPNAATDPGIGSNATVH